VLETRSESGTDGRSVTLIGHVTAVIGSKYLFTDGTGYVHLNGGGSALPMGPSLVVTGRIRHPFLGLGHVEVVVKNWRYGVVP
jgi:hypothetical protein